MPCHICKQDLPLTFEHLPPRSAFNDKKVFLFDLKGWLNRDEKGNAEGAEQYQRGAGAQTLCAKCNNATGSWYVPELTEWSHMGMNILHRLPKEVIETVEGQPGLKIKGKMTVGNAHPLRFVKQVVTMLLAMNGPRFGDVHPELGKFVLDRDATGLPDKFKFGICLYAGPISRYAPVGAMISTTNGEITVMTELGVPPFSYVLVLEGNLPEGIADISSFCQYQYDEQADLSLDLDVSFGHTPHALDYQSTADKKLQRDRQKDL